MAKQSNHYVDNEKFYEEIVKYRKELEYAEANGLPEPDMNNYIGDCIIKIATKFSYNNKFINYSYKEEMIGDGIEVCINGIKKFDYVNWQNPFAYLTQCCFYAFISRIKREKTQQYIRSEMIKEMGADSFDLQEVDLDEDFRNDFVKFLESNMNVSGEFLKKKPKVKKKEVGPLEEDFMNE